MHKYSFPPITSQNPKVLILGSLPGDMSITKNEYYGHARNRFWKVLASLLQTDIPENYEQKVALVRSNQLAVWDVAMSAIRPGSLDTAIKDELPNEIHQFLDKNSEVKCICFNGQKAAAMYKKHFQLQDHIIYLTLPSTSPANAGCSLEKLIEQWKQLLVYL